MMIFRILSVSLLVLSFALTGCWRSFGTEEDRTTCYTQLDCDLDQQCSADGICVCDAEKCEGCCVDGRCEVGDSVRACGPRCVRCAEEGMECIDGECQIPPSCDECTHRGRRVCLPDEGPNVFRVCNDSDPDGCLRWHVSECGDGRECDVESNRCVEPGCVGVPHECSADEEGQDGCVEGSDDVFQCSRDRNGCFSWIWSYECVGDSFCADSACTIIEECNSDCDSDAYPRCSDVDPYKVLICIEHSVGATICYREEDYLCGDDEICARGEGGDGCVLECPEWCESWETECTALEQVRTCEERERLNGEFCWNLSDPHDCEIEDQSCRGGSCCADECSEWEPVCNPFTFEIYECAAQIEGGCLELGESWPCEDPSEVCLSGGCVDPCPEDCSEGDAPECDEWAPDTRYVCVAFTTADGTIPCWNMQTEYCGLNQFCEAGVCQSCPSDAEATCAANGTVECNTASEPNLFRVCTESEGGCRMWSEWIACRGGNTCDTGICEFECDNECTDDNETRCVGDHAMQLCLPVEPDCSVWSSEVPCDDGWICLDYVGACLPPHLT